MTNNDALHRSYKYFLSVGGRKYKTSHKEAVQPVYDYIDVERRTLELERGALLQLLSAFSDRRFSKAYNSEAGVSLLINDLAPDSLERMVAENFHATYGCFDETTLRLSELTSALSELTAFINDMSDAMCTLENVTDYY